MQFRATVLSAAALLVVPLVMVTESTASADPLPEIVTCAGTAQQQYSPGLTLNSRPTQLTALNEFSCLTGPVASGTQAFTATVNAGCLPDGTTSYPSTAVFDWNTGTDSIINGTITVTRPVGQTVATMNGTVTSGQFSGYAVTNVVTYVAPDLVACLGSEGVTSAEGTFTTVLTQL